MRKIEKLMIAALAQGDTLNSGNTRIHYPESHGPAVVTLFGNVIARYWDATGKLEVTDAGWQTFTTKSRINALLDRFALGYGIIQRDGVWYLTETRSYGQRVHQWDGAATFIDGRLEGWEENDMSITLGDNASSRRVVLFCQVPIGQFFRNNGNLYYKRSKRTAELPIAGRIFYFRRYERVDVHARLAQNIVESGS